jgi:hypothetical protein
VEIVMLAAKSELAANVPRGASSGEVKLFWQEFNDASNVGFTQISLANLCG